MRPRPTRRLTFLVLVLSGLAWAAAVATLAAAGHPGASASSPAPTALAVAAQAGNFVGDDTCLACHESEGKSLQGTLHGKSRNERTPSARTNQTCETCHGPGRDHSETGDAKKIRVFTTVAAKNVRDASDTCLACHDRGDHAMWKGGMHEARNLTCATCHSVHSPKSEHAQLKAASVVDTCVNCHKTEVAKLQRFGHMPVREGKMDCTACHNPHGSTNVRLLKTGNWINESCVSCHTEKRGPFLFDHAAGRESCKIGRAHV